MSDQYLVGKNAKTPVKKVKHSDLIRAGHGDYKSICPACDKGLLLMVRDPNRGFKLMAEDHCMLCGQRYEYTDIDELNKGEI
jgi:uncharacterized protein (DUF983 family)